MTLALRAFLGLLLALVPAGVVLVQMEREARSHRAVDLAQDAGRLLERVTAHQSATIAAARQLLNALSATPRLRGQDCPAFLDRVREAYPRYLGASVTDAEGRAVCSSRSEAPADDLLAAALRDNAFRLGGYQDGGSLGLAEPLRDAAGRAVGAVGLTLSLDWLGRDLEAIGLPAESTAILADRQGTVLASSQGDGPRVGSALGAFSRELLSAPTAGVRPSPDGMRQVAYAPPAAGALGLFVAVELAEHRASQMAGQWIPLTVVGALLLSFLLALFTFHAAADGPIQSLLGAARRWSAHDWRARVGRIGGGGEFRRLAAAFDDMAAAVETRQRAEARWQACMATAPMIVLASDRQGRVEWVNNQWREATGFDLERSRGDGWLAAIDPSDRRAVEAAWRAALADPTGSPLLQELSLQGGHRCLLKGAPALDADGAVLSWAVFGLDVRELRQAEALADATDARLRAIYAHAPVGLCVLDLDLRFLAVNERMARAHGPSIAEHLGRRLGEVTPAFAAQLESSLRHLLETGEAVEDIEFCVGPESDQRCWLCSCHPVRDRDGVVIAISGAVIDITARRRMEDSARRLSQEVDHRAQNALSVVRGLLRLTAADAPDDVPALVEDLEGRIGAMSRAHDVLSRERWLGADLGEIVVRELAAYPGNIETSGPPLRLVAAAVQALSLVLHELLTNALRHGGLSERGGRVKLDWERTEQGAELRWIESGGPPVDGAPERVGLGTMLIDANMQTQLAGHIHRDWNAAGLTCVLTIGAEALTPEAQGPSLGGGPLAGRRALLVDDDPFSAHSFAAALRESGCEVLGPARSAAEALILAGQAGRVDVAVLAGRLAGRAAQELAEDLRARAGVVMRLSDQEFGGSLRTPHHLRAALVDALAKVPNG